MRMLATLLLVLGLSFNTVAASACVDADSGTHVMPAAMADMGPEALAGGEMPCDCCDGDQPNEMDCLVLCLSTAPLLAAPDSAIQAPLFADTHPALGDLLDPESQGPSTPRRPPRLQS